MERMNSIEHRTWSIEKSTDIKSLRSTLYAQRSSQRSTLYAHRSSLRSTLYAQRSSLLSTLTAPLYAPLPWKTRTVLNNKIINETGSRIRYYKNETRKFELLQGLPGIR